MLDVIYFIFFLLLQTTLRFEISREDEVVKKLDLSFNILIFVEVGTRYVGVTGSLPRRQSLLARHAQRAQRAQRRSAEEANPFRILSLSHASQVQN